MKKWLTLLAALLMIFNAGAAIDTYQFDSRQQEQQYRELTASLRCPKCQNNSIADSNAMIAADMRLKVYQLTTQGQTKQQIIAYMVARYGNFVSYAPPVTPSTLILWVGPALFIVMGALLIILRSRRRGALSPEQLEAAERQRLERLLKHNRES